MRNMHYRWLSLCLCLVATTTVFSQDRIYLQNDTKDGKVVDITADKIKFQDPKREGSVVTVARNKVLLLFNNAGHFLVIPKLTDDGEQSQFMIKDFINAVATGGEQTDKLITLQHDVINCHIEAEEIKTVKFSTAEGQKQINKSALAVIIYKDGQHKVIPDVKKVVEPLGAVQLSLALSRNTTPTKAEEKKEEVAATEPVVQPVTATPAVDTAVKTTTTTTTEPTVDSAVATSTATPAGATEKTGKQQIEELGEVKFEEYERKALEKTNDLKIYIQQLCDRSLEWTDANKFIDQAVNLFVDENARVETSTTTSQSITRYKIREYLRRIKLIQYDKVEIEWTNVQYVSKLRKGPDGNYYGIITFEQTFKGYSGDNQLQYSDVTRKNIEVVLKTYNRNVEGKSVPTWDVFLSEIKVISTKA
jgi:hypothetical protein